MTDRDYVHGYSSREAERLRDQAGTLTALLHGDTRYADGETVLEAGCGVGAQTAILARHSPGARITALDISAESLDAARRRVAEARAHAAGKHEDEAPAPCFADVTFRQGDVFDPPFGDAAFDHVFVCFVLEHLADPAGALRSLRRVLRPGGTLTVIEGDHDSALFHPGNADTRRAIDALADLQARAGGDARIGRRLYPLVAGAGYRDVCVTPRVVYADASRPEMVEGFTRNTFTAMVEGVRGRALAAGLMDAAAWDCAIDGLHAAAGPEGTFLYTFFKAVARR